MHMMEQILTKSVEDAMEDMPNSKNSHYIKDHTDKVCAWTYVFVSCAFVYLGKDEHVFACMLDEGQRADTCKHGHARRRCTC